MDNKNVVIIVTIALLIAVIGFMAYDKTRSAEIVIPPDGAGTQLPKPPTPSDDALITEPPAADLDLAKSVFAWGEAGEEITGTIVFIDTENGVIYFTESESGDLYYTLIVSGLSDAFLDGRPATLDEYYIGMPLTVRWIEEEAEATE